MPPIKVLACDADPAALLVLTETLTFPEFQLSAIMDSARLFDMIRADQPDRIILGRLSTGLESSVILDAIRNDPSACCIPVIVCSDQPLVALTAREYGEEYFRTGNFDPRDLAVVIRRM